MSYFKPSNRKMPKDCPITLEDIEDEWDRMVDFAMKRGYLKKTGGMYKGRGEPDDWFDAYEDHSKKYRK